MYNPETNYVVSFALNAVEPVVPFESRATVFPEHILLYSLESPEAGGLGVVGAKMVPDPTGVSALLGEFLDGSR
jgi:hypothetical protein